MGLRLNRKGDEDAKSFRKNLDWPHYFCTGGHHFQALRNSSGNPAALWLAPAPRAHLTRYHGFGTTAPFWSRHTSRRLGHGGRKDNRRRGSELSCLRIREY